MTRPQRKALDILADCSEGATHDALLACGCAPDAMAALVEIGAAGVRTAPMANPRGLVVTRYWITDAGRLLLKATSGITPGDDDHQKTEKTRWV